MRTMVEFGHTKIEDRIGKSGILAEEGDIVEVVKGRKFPIGMKFVVTKSDLKYYRQYYPNRRYNGFADATYIAFYDMTDSGIKEQYINAENVVIVAKDEDREDNPEYKNVHRVEVWA